MNWYIVLYSVAALILIGLSTCMIKDCMLSQDEHIRTSFRHGLSRYYADNENEAYMLRDETFRQSKYNNFNLELNNGCLACGSSTVAKMQQGGLTENQQK